MKKLGLSIFAFVMVSFFGTELGRAQNVSEGKKLYATFCSSCHGEDGKGDGAAAQSLPVKPANHTDGAAMNQLSDRFLLDIISKGGPAVGKSPVMPGWASQIKEPQLRDILAYIRSIAQPPYKAPGK
jgi:mono/diheme cytochrome c family protein